MFGCFTFLMISLQLILEIQSEQRRMWCAYQFFSVRMVCDSWQRGMASIWLRSFETMVEKAGCPLYPGSREKSGYAPDPKHGPEILFNTHLTQYTGGQLSFALCEEKFSMTCFSQIILAIILLHREEEHVDFGCQIVLPQAREDIAV